MSENGDYISRKAAINAAICTSPMMPSQWLPIQHAIEAIPTSDVRPVSEIEKIIVSLQENANFIAMILDADAEGKVWALDFYENHIKPPKEE